MSPLIFLFVDISNYIKSANYRKNSHLLTINKPKQQQPCAESRYVHINTHTEKLTHNTLQTFLFLVDLAPRAARRYRFLGTPLAKF